MEVLMLCVRLFDNSSKMSLYGFAVLCLDHPEVQSLAGRIDDRWVITYGANPQADVRFLNLSMDGQKRILMFLFVHARQEGRLS